MREGDIEPLEPGLWLQQCRSLALRNVEKAEHFERALRHAFHLVQLAPRPLRQIVNCRASEEEFERFLETGAIDAATFELIGDELGFSVSRSAGERSVVAEVLPAGGRLFGASGPSVAEALFQAWLKYLSAFDEAAGPAAAVSPPSPRTARSELHPKQNEH